ncbi:MAG: hypothetical protein HUJ93_04775, partial [Bacteroidales bacterium]|nr:hypothetical protein [Bacteroidales bacterium]
MIRLSLLALLLALLPTALLPSPIQAADDDAPDLVVPEQFATFFYRNDDQFTAMLDMEIDSIMFAFNDLDYHRYPYAVRQVIYCGDSILSIPLEAIDSIGLVTPPVKINPELFLVDAEINKYVTAVDSLSFCMSKLAPRFPTEGQIVMTTCYDGVLKDLGACGRVSKIRSIGDTYKFELDFTDLSPADFFDQLITANLSLVQEEEGGDIKKILFTSASAQAEGSGGETNTDKRSAAQVFADAIKNTFIGKHFKWGDSSIFSEDGWWIEYHGFNHYDPEDCEDLDSYDGGKYMSYGFTPKLTLKFNIVTNIQKVLDWIEGAEEYVASTNEYIKLGVYVGLDLTLFAKFGFKTSVGDVKDEEMVAVDREDYERMLKEYKKIFPEGKKMKSSFKCMDGIHVRLIPTVPVLDLHIVPLAPAFSEYQKQPKESRGDLEDIFIPNSIALDVDLSANANFWFEVGAELQKINGKWEKNFFKDYGCDIGGKISVEGSFDVFAGIAPSIGLGIVDARIVELALVGNLGGYIKGNISAGLSTSTANKSILDFTEPMSPNDIAEVTRRYDTYYGPNKSRLSTGIRIGLTPNISIGKGIPGFDPILDEPIPLPKFGDENSMIAEGLNDVLEGIDFEIYSLGLLPMAKDIEVTPNIPDLRDPTSYTYNISYKTYGNTIKNYSMGLLVMDCAEPQKRYVQWSEKELFFFSGLTKYMTQDFEFNMAGLEAGKVYSAFPVVWLFGDPKAYSKDMFDR